MKSTNKKIYLVIILVVTLLVVAFLAGCGNVSADKKIEVQVLGSLDLPGYYTYLNKITIPEDNLTCYLLARGGLWCKESSEKNK